MTEPMAIRVLRAKVASNDGSVTIQQETANVILAEYDRRADRDQLHAALTELVDASRDARIFDTVRCNRWHAAVDMGERMLAQRPHPDTRETP